jgi:hypothetical protein
MEYNSRTTSTLFTNQVNSMTVHLDLALRSNTSYCLVFISLNHIADAFVARA